MALQNCHFRY